MNDNKQCAELERMKEERDELKRELEELRSSRHVIGQLGTIADGRLLTVDVDDGVIVLGAAEPQIMSSETVESDRIEKCSESKIKPTMKEKMDLLDRIVAGEVDVKDDGTIKTLGRGPTVEPEYIHSYKEWTERFPDHTPAININPHDSASYIEHLEGFIEQLKGERDRLKELLESTTMQLHRTQTERNSWKGKFDRLNICREEYQCKSPEAPVYPAPGPGGHVMCKAPITSETKKPFDPKDVESACEGCYRNGELISALNSLRSTIALDVRDWSVGSSDAWIYAILAGWDDEENPGSMAEIHERHGWLSTEIERLRRYNRAIESARLRKEES